MISCKMRDERESKRHKISFDRLLIGAKIHVAVLQGAFMRRPDLEIASLEGEGSRPLRSIHDHRMEGCAMTAQSDTTVQTPPLDRTAEMSKIYTEGIVAGLIGAATIAIWFLLLDTIQGRPLYTPTVLGTALFGPPGLASSEMLPVSFEMTLWFTWVHGLVFILIGGAASWLVRLAEQDPNYGFGILLFLVVFEFGFIGIGMVFAEGVLHALTWPAILVGNLLAAAAMAWYFRHRHPHLRINP